ncbi:hypothetical protein DIS18_03090 [Algibacter marinivivus]|uniref:TonB protein C-terminal n=1 Tax=Algibacter marinivivus TaxID=2100723 RepID=A0A2U2X718_9FLAO|nr:hypothetical protein [Algibacter marinivivus]PWH83554.1 hypothetical protein DIS18_03090 [Algibacter marinivivus]
MKYSFVFIFVLLFTACDYFNVKKTSSEAILKEELETFNWNNVDEYPSFTICDSVLSKVDKKACFQETITTNITDFLQKEMIVVSQDIHDTLVLEFQVSKQGMLRLLESRVDSVTLQEIPNIKELLNRSLDTLPKIYPAIKRGQQVTTEFNLPIIISVN